MSSIKTNLTVALAGIAVIIGTVIVVVSIYGTATTTCVSTSAGGSSCTTDTTSLVFIVMFVFIGLGLVGAGITTLRSITSSA